MDLVSSTVSLVDVSVRLVKYLKGIHEDSRTIENDIHSLIREVEAICAVTNSIKALRQDSIDKDETEYSPISELWRKISTTIVDCEKVLKSLDRTIKEIYGQTPDATSPKDAFMKVRRMRAREGQLSSYKESLSSSHHVLGSLLKVISLQQARISEENHAKLYTELRDDMSSLRETLNSRIDEPPPYSTSSHFQTLRRSVDAAVATLTAGSHNEFFDLPQSVSPIFTGRQALLDDLRDAFISPNFKRQDKQRRFVIHGLGGSGKTQFACKFAEDNQYEFFGVFWVDASTSERLNQTFAQLAKQAQAEPNVKSALHWLSTLEERWLLIIDNADDPDIKINEYFPHGNRGHILITTKNPTLKNIGNVGCGFYHFRGLEIDESNRLLLRAANHPDPWEKLDDSTQKVVAKISEVLDALAIAITYAGTAIADGMCDLVNYLDFYNSNWHMVRKKRKGKKLDDEEKVFATWEMCFYRLESKNTQSTRDAIQLLKTFAFFHHEDIRHDILLRAMTNSQLEAEQEKNQKEDAKETSAVPAKSFWEEVKGINLAILRFILIDRTPPVLPHVIRAGRNSSSKSSSVKEFDYRIRKALSELTHMALITSYRKGNTDSYSYSIHPIVHRWMREREEMGNSEQILWAEAASNLLSASILLPPLGSTPEDESFNRHLLPHIDHVRRCLEEKNKMIIDSRKDAWRILPFSPNNAMNPARAVQAAKFGVVYMQCGRFTDTESLMRSVRNYTYSVLGPGDAKSRRVSLVLSDVLWHLERVDEATEIQQEVIDICIKSLPKDHPDTFRAMDKLGQTLFLQGRYTEAKKIQDATVDGLKKTLKWNSEDCLIARDNLAKTIGRFWEKEHLETAYKMHGEVVEEMTRQLGAESLKTLSSMENMAHSAMFLDEKCLQIALALMERVVTRRRAKLGKESPYTLLGMVNLALVKLTMGNAVEAEELIRTGLPIAERTLGEDHIGVSFGKSALGSTLLPQQRYAEAESLLSSASEAMKTMRAHRGHWHPDRLGTLIELAKCYRLQGKFAESIEICNEALIGFEEISRREHPLARALKKDCGRMEEHLEKLSHEHEIDDQISTLSDGGYKLYHCF